MFVPSAVSNVLLVIFVLGFVAGVYVTRKVSSWFAPFRKPEER